MTRSTELRDANAPGCLQVIAFVGGITALVMVVARWWV